MNPAKITSAAVAVALAAAGIVATTAPSSSAAVRTSVRGISGVLYPGCHYYQFRYTIDPDKAAYDWSLHVTAYDRRGSEATSASVWKEDDYRASGRSRGTDGLFFCDSALTGRYRLTAELNFYGGPYSDEQVNGAGFTMRDARSRTRIAASDKRPDKGQVVKFRVRSLLEYPRGFFGEDFTEVVLQTRKQSGKWKRFDYGYTNDRGRVTFRGRWLDEGPVPVRAVTPRTDEHARSISRVIVLR